MMIDGKKRLIIRLAHYVLIGLAACSGSNGGAQVPDAISGVVVDAATGSPLAGAEVGIDINEERSIPFPFIGPEGTPRPMFRRSLGVKTDANGEFSIDLRAVKRELSSNHPNERWVMHRVHIYKRGYGDQFQAYTAAGQTFRLKKEVVGPK